MLFCERGGAREPEAMTAGPGPVARGVGRAASDQSGGRLTLFRDLLALSTGHVASKLVGFAAFAFLARTLGPEGYGVVEYLAGLSLVFVMMVDGGLGVAGVRRVAHDPTALPRLAAQIPLARLGLALIGIPLMLLLAAGAIPGAEARGLMWLFALSLLAIPWRQDWLLQATHRMREVALAQALRMIVFAAVTVTLVRTPADLLAVGWAEMAAVSAMSLYCLAVQQARITPYRWRAPVTGLTALLAEGMTVGLGHLVWAANLYAPLLLVTALAGGAETAWFAAASRVIASLLTFSSLYHFNIYPAVARATPGDRDELARALAASCRVVAWGGTLVALALTLLAPPLAVLVFGARFEPSAPMLMVLAWLFPIALMSGHARWSLTAAGLQSRVVVSQLAGSAVLAVIGVPSVWWLGGRGAALASLAAGIAVWFVAHTFAVRNGTRLPRLRIALGPTAIAVLIIGVTHLVGLNGWSAAVGVPLFAAVALLDPKLRPDLARLGRLPRSGSPAVPEAVA
jgi:O-antigen/teichoic acid export membrane protein